MSEIICSCGNAIGKYVKDQLTFYPGAWRHANCMGATTQTESRDTLLVEVERLRDIESKAIAQSEEIQKNWLSPNEIIALRAENERLRKIIEHDGGESGMSQHCACVEPLEADVRRLTTALEWYADKKHHSHEDEFGYYKRHSDIDDDGGNVARVALKENE